VTLSFEQTQIFTVISLSLSLFVSEHQKLYFKLIKYNMAFATRLLQRLYESTSAVLLVSFLLPLLLIWLVRRLRYLRSLPPGPTGYPIFGILPLITKQFHLQLFDYAQRFGRLLSFRMGSQLVVVLNDPNIIKKAFARPEFSGRPRSALSSILDGYGTFNKKIVYIKLLKK
jgi:hypothetical protein